MSMRHGGAQWLKSQIVELELTRPAKPEPPVNLPNLITGHFPENRPMSKSMTETLVRPWFNFSLGISVLLADRMSAPRAVGIMLTGVLT